MGTWANSDAGRQFLRNMYPQPSAPTPQLAQAGLKTVFGGDSAPSPQSAGMVTQALPTLFGSRGMSVGMPAPIFDEDHRQKSAPSSGQRYV